MNIKFFVQAKHTERERVQLEQNRNRFSGRTPIFILRKQKFASRIGQQELTINKNEKDRQSTVYANVCLKYIIIYLMVYNRAAC